MRYEALLRAVPLAGIAILLAALPVLGQTVHVEGIDSLHVKSNLQGQFNSTSVDDEPDTAWLVRRARIMIRMFAAGWIRADVEGDFGRGGARLTDGFVRLDFGPRARIRAGQYKKPFDTLELVSSRELLVIERDGLARGTNFRTPNSWVKELGYSDRDIGAEWSGRFDPVTVTAGFWNGAGANRAEDDDGKQVGLRVDVAGPVGATISGAWAGRRVTVGGLGGRGEWRNAFEVALALGEYGAAGWKALAQFMAGDGVPQSEVESEAQVLPPSDFAAFQALAAYHVPIWNTPYVIGIEPVARVGWVDPFDDLDDDEATLWTAGINLYHHRYLKTQIQVDHVRPSQGGGETAARIQLGLGF